MASSSIELDAFLRPLAMDTGLVLKLAKDLTSTFKTLSRESPDQFLTTPISEPILRHVAQSDSGRFLAIDIGGTNLRVGFVELLGKTPSDKQSNGVDGHRNAANGHAEQEKPTHDRLRLLLEHKEPIGNHLKNEKAEDLFKWIGSIIAGVVRKAVDELGLPSNADLPMGVTFSFPMYQSSLSQARLKDMGKGFAITSNLDLGEHLMKGYHSNWTPDIPRIKIAAISNDTIATLVSHIYQFPVESGQKTAMGLIVGTGCNATILMKLSSLPENKRPEHISVLPGQNPEDVRIAVNTEWSINGTAAPLRDLGLISSWDTDLDEAGERPGFQPLEYMTAGRYLGELARLAFLDFLTTVLRHDPTDLPGALHQRFGLTTTFISQFYPDSKKGPMLDQLRKEFNPTAQSDFNWAQDHANALHRIAKAIEVRAAGIIAAATLALLVCTEELPAWDSPPSAVTEEDNIPELVVGWTGGCIQHFQTYLQDCQTFLDAVLSLEYNGNPPARVVFSPCHDGGIKGAGILVPAALASETGCQLQGNPSGISCTSTANMSEERATGAQQGRDSSNNRKPRTWPTSTDASRSAHDQGEAANEEAPDLPVPRFPIEPVFEPELLESPMFHNMERHMNGRRPTKGHPRQHAPSRQSASDEEVFADETPEADVETPLLKKVAGSTSSCSSSNSSNATTTNEPTKDPDNPYTGGVTVPQFWSIFLVVACTFFIFCFDATILASSHPVITSYFGASHSASWLSTAFLLTSTTFQPLVVRYSDTVGRKWPYVVTMGIFAGATVWCALAGSMTSLIVARAVCGLGAGGAMSCGGVLAGDLVPIEIRGIYQSYLNIAFGTGGMLGAALGGVMADHLGWRWEFGVQVPLILVCMAVAAWLIPANAGLYDNKRESLVESMKVFDFTGSGLMTVSITFLIIGLNLGGNILPWSHPLILTSLTLFTLGFPLFLLAERRATRPIMPLELVSTVPNANIVLSNFLGAVLINALIFNVPLYFQGVLLKSATTSGLYLLVPTVVSSVTGTATGYLIYRTKRLKWPLMVGSAGFLTGTVFLTSLDRSCPEALFLLALVPASAGQGFSFPGTFMALLNLWEQRRQSVVTSTIVLWRSLGMVLGVAGSSLVVQNALLFYLRQYVDLPGGEEENRSVIELVREKVAAVKGLEGVAREQVIRSYEDALRLTFLCCAVLAVGNLLLVAPIRLPRLGKGERRG
ncbi:major facilitator superfamily domain-containing protein [Coniochaeta sp. 2T2.1]|nr:major facilitator superfamily domain-containing protein [Coniochaeta sp. 2T2.1]